MAAPPLDLARRIANCAIDHYDHALPSNTGGKPQNGREWTVFSAVVAHAAPRDDGHGCAVPCPDTDMWVVSCATGSKCTSIRAIVSSLPSSASTLPNRQREGKSVTSKGNGPTDANTTRKCGKKKPTIEMDRESILSCYNGMVLKDSHAEVLARRGLVAYLWEEIETSLQRGQGASREATEPCPARYLLELAPATPNPDASGGMTFQLKRNITLHLYISDSPCGDAAIYEIQRKRTRQSHEDQAQSESSGKLQGSTEVADSRLNFTGAKIILLRNQGQRASIDNSIASVLTCSLVRKTENDDAQQSTITLGREHTQQLGALRLKSSRSNILPALRSTSLCCSDKLVRWGVMGMQGALLSRYIPAPLCLTSICVSKDERGTCGGQLVALERAISGRIDSAVKLLPRTQNSKPKPPEVAVVERVLECSKSAAEHRYAEAQISSKKRNREHCYPEKNTQQNPAKKRYKAGSVGSQRSSCKDEARRQPQAGGAGQSAKKESPCGMSLNWYRNHRDKDTSGAFAKGKAMDMEITVGATGLKRGKKPKTPEDVLVSASRLCRYHLLRRCQNCAAVEAAGTPSRRTEKIQGATTGGAAGSEEAEQVGYRQYKQRRCGIGDHCFQGPLQGWVRSGQEDDFVPP